ncbi:hypothetical protein EBU91_03720 [bacterium]|nr:hypothetical protein [bacterium]
MRAIVPGSQQWSFSVKTRDFIDILTRAKTTGEAGVGIAPHDDGVSVTSHGESMEFEDTVEVDWQSGDEAMIKIGINPRYLLDACKALAGADTVTVAGNDPMSPVAVYSQSLGAKDAVICIVMPMRL